MSNPNHYEVTGIVNGKPVTMQRPIHAWNAQHAFRRVRAQTPEISLMTAKIVQPPGTEPKTKMFTPTGMFSRKSV